MWAHAAVEKEYDRNTEQYWANRRKKYHAGK